MYDTPRGVVFGEFTPAPDRGKLTFDPVWDRRLLEIWRQSLEELGLDYWSPAALLAGERLAVAAAT